MERKWFTALDKIIITNKLKIILYFLDDFFLNNSGRGFSYFTFVLKINKLSSSHI